MSIPKEILSLAGEFAVASELCRRGVYAQLTLGPRKRTDLLVETEENFLRIQVKAKQGAEWPGCKGIFGRDIVLIFVDFQTKKETERPDFYILTVEDWEELLKQELIEPGRVKRGEVIITERNVPIWKDGYQGHAVRAASVANYRERWDTIVSLLGRRRPPRSEEMFPALSGEE